MSSIAIMVLCIALVVIGGIVTAALQLRKWSLVSTMEFNAHKVRLNKKDMTMTVLSRNLQETRQEVEDLANMVCKFQAKDGSECK